MSHASQSFSTFGPKKLLRVFCISLICGLKLFMYSAAFSTSYSAGNGFSQSTSSTPQKISTSIASWPFWRSAPQIPVPETMEISLSVLVPPAKTTIFMILHLLVCAVRNFVMIVPIYLRTSIYSYTTTGMPTSILA